MSKTDRLGAPEKFVAKPYVICGTMTGAGSGLFNPGNMAQEEIGDVNWGETLAYMTRRFGPPNVGSDPYKEICGWLVSTPMDGVALSVRITPHGTWLLFGYMIDKEMERDLYAIKHARQDGWRERFAAWCQATHGREPTSWTQSRRSMDVGARDNPLPPEARVAASKEFEEWRAAFDAQDVVPQTGDDRLDRAKEALRRTIRDLKRTVSVRDSDISIHGTSQPFRHVAYDSRAGVAPPSYTRDDEMWKVYAAVHRLGGGMKGLRRLTAIIEREVPAATDRVDDGEIV